MIYTLSPPLVHSAMRLSRLDLREVVLGGLQGRMHRLKLLELVELQLEVAHMMWLQVLMQ